MNPREIFEIDAMQRALKCTRVGHRCMRFLLVLFGQLLWWIHYFPVHGMAGEKGVGDLLNKPTGWVSFDICCQQDLEIARELTGWGLQGGVPIEFSPTAECVSGLMCSLR